MTYVFSNFVFTYKYTQNTSNQQPAESSHLLRKYKLEDKSFIIQSLYFQTFAKLSELTVYHNWQRDQLTIAVKLYL